MTKLAKSVSETGYDSFFVANQSSSDAHFNPGVISHLVQDKICYNYPNHNNQCVTKPSQYFINLHTLATMGIIQIGVDVMCTQLKGLMFLLAQNTHN